MKDATRKKITSLLHDFGPPYGSFLEKAMYAPIVFAIVVPAIIYSGLSSLFGKKHSV